MGSAIGWSMVGVCDEVVGLAGVDVSPHVGLLILVGVRDSVLECVYCVVLVDYSVATVVGAEVGFATALAVGCERYFVGFAVELMIPVVVEDFGIVDKLEG